MNVQYWVGDHMSVSPGNTISLEAEDDEGGCVDMNIDVRRDRRRERESG
jgi:hypothetical protein